MGEPVGPSGDKFKPKKKALISATEMEGIKHKLLASSYTSTGADLKKLFSWLDRDGEGGIDYDEFSRGIRRGKITPTLLSDVHLRALFKAVDTDGSGTIELEEMIEFIGFKGTGPEGDKYKPAKQKMISDEEMSHIRHKLLASSYTQSGADLKKLFGQLDRDNEVILHPQINPKVPKRPLILTLTLTLLGGWD